jgi:AcrR family transcriptional regulator
MNSRQNLIQSAQELLWERGYVGMSPKAIQERSGAGQGSMYHHFKGKGDLAAEAIQQRAGLYGENFCGVKQLSRSVAQIYRKTDR